MNNKKNYSPISALILFLASADPVWAENNNIEFETRALDINDKQNISLSNFSRPDYTPEGNYLLTLRLNNRTIGTFQFHVLEIDNSAKVCFSPELLYKFDLKSSVLKGIMNYQAPGDSSCILVQDYEGSTVKFDRQNSELLLTIQQSFLNYSDPNWTPPAQWDEGIPGILFDYTASGNIYQNKQNARNLSLSGYGTAGVNLGAWRLRSNHQAFLYKSNQSGRQSRFSTSAAYLARSLNTVGAHLTIGRHYLSSEVFDSIDYTGVTIASDDRMLPPALRGYAPIIEGVANSNAKVIITRGDDNVVYERMVPPGNFIIDDLSDTTSGELKITIREENGEERTSTIQTSNVPFLTRSGHIRYNIMLGKSNINNSPFNPYLVSGEASVGILSGASLFGGLILTDENYYAINSGIGYDMNILGALSFDMTHTDVQLNNSTLRGQSYRINYSKVFDSINSQITFAGYRFSEKNFMTLSDFVTIKGSPDYNSTSSSKESYNIVGSKSFSDLGFSLNAMYTKQTYWQDVSDSNTYGLSISKSFDIAGLNNVSTYLSVSRTEYKKSFHMQSQRNNNAVYLSFNIPLSSKTYMNSAMRSNNGKLSPSMSYTNNIDHDNSWSIGASTYDSLQHTKINANSSQKMDRVATTLNASMSEQDYYLGGNIKSGFTTTSHGVVMHRDGYSGNSRLLIDTNGISGVYIGNGARSEQTNTQGLAVINNVPEYYRTDYSVDANRLPDDIDSSLASIQTVLTKGAIGYRKLNMYRGIKAFIRLSDAQGRPIPFGTTVEDIVQKRSAGMVGENGEVYISGVSKDATLKAMDAEGRLCTFSLQGHSVSLSSNTAILCKIN
ncbi:fimbria/pilus outer membrane usher protein [Serratia fonticola]|uniref:Fimbria/pilus outer membrane usher protein n=1 Tax=Serratia fonticola TaxID=47917 RepID=A0ABY9PQW4_SERFO|nr:fimbria/pilus outer membrane usher protein [Serratia fonticola]WMT15816.1 fimbria/pilus outer membrane usher protein [Serratia fonticola]